MRLETAFDDSFKKAVGNFIFSNTTNGILETSCLFLQQAIFVFKYIWCPFNSNLAASFPNIAFNHFRKHSIIIR